MEETYNPKKGLKAIEIGTVERAIPEYHRRIHRITTKQSQVERSTFSF